MQKWTTPSICFLIGSILIFLIPPIGHSCGPGFPEFYGYSFIDKNIIPKNIPYAPFLLRFDDLVQNYANPASVQMTTNIEEWQARTCPSVPLADIQSIIYTTPLQQIQLIKTAAQSESASLPPRLQNNEFARFLASKKCVETLDYIVFAKQCEPHVITSKAWDTPKRDTLAMEHLIQQGKKAFKKTNSHYIRLRYAYQLIRLAHYKGNYRQTLDLHTYLMPKVDAHPSILDYWIMGHRAGALKGLGQNVEASYLYSLIFKHSPAKRQAAFQSFYIKTDEEWNACLLMCKDDAERAMLYTIRANAHESKAAEEMQKIYELDPDNGNLPLLLIKEMRKLEKDFMGNSFNINKRENNRYYQIPRKKSAQYLVDLQQLVQNIVGENRIKNKDIWWLADAYLTFLASDFYGAEKKLNLAHEKIQNDTLQSQIQAFQLALKINNYRKIATEEEEEISEIIKDNPLYKQHPDFHNYLFDKLNYTYTQQGEIGKAFRTLHPANDLRFNINLEIIDDLLAICNKKKPSRLEEALISKSDGSTIKNDLLELKTTYYMSRFQFEAALETIKEIPRTERDTTEIHPYRNAILDCVNCIQEDTLSFTKTTLIEKMLDLNYQARADLQKGAAAFYELGLIFYNLSYYGNAWRGMDYFRSSSNWGHHNESNVYPLYGAPDGNHENKDCSQALFYFEKARLLTKDRELAARSTFMAAKCQHNEWYNHPKNKRSYYSNNMPVFPTAYQSYFDMLRSDYQDTKFYSEAIQECKYFRWYALK